MYNDVVTCVSNSLSARNFLFIYLCIVHFSVSIYTDLSNNQQLILGVPAYGRSWTLAGSNSSPGAAAAGAGRQGRYINESGNLPFFECCLAEQVLLSDDKVEVALVIRLSTVIRVCEVCKGSQ